VSGDTIYITEVVACALKCSLLALAVLDATTLAATRDQLCQLCG